MNQKQRDEFVRLLGEGDLAHSDIILAVDRLRARVEVLEGMLSERTAEEEKKIDDIVEGLPARLLVLANGKIGGLEARVAELEEPGAWSASMVGLELRIKYDRGSLSIEVVKPIGEEMEIQIDDQHGKGGTDG